ncbi:ABC transporter permease [Olivibacter sitiensis]|uniref:ABC transporter permease n=1 Tax=Olivibacter sitiensis TaxID=376470 RepID=UPI0003F5AD95|nr:ABC transporter permease [Olivibacter sitiensis]
MLRSYFKIAWRNLERAKGYAFINIFGLAIGMAAAAIIILWVENEWTFDRFYTNTDRIYEVYNRGNFNNDTYAWEGVGNPLAPILQNNHAELEKVVRSSATSGTLSVNDRYFNSEGIFADSDFFHLFDFPVIHDSLGDRLASINNIVVTASLAEKLFGTNDVVGKHVQLDSADNFTITAVLQDIPSNSRFKDVAYFLPWNYFERSIGPEIANSWVNLKVPTYVLLKPEVRVEQVESKLRNTLVDLKIAQNELFLHPATQWHLYNKAEHGYFTGGIIDKVRLFTFISLAILLIACINFMNLSTAKSEQRAKEVGIRKVVGAQRKTLVYQFLSESILLAALAACLAFVFLFLSLKPFNDLLGTSIQIPYMDFSFWCFAIGFVLTTGFLAGSYPAFLLSSFKPVKVLKGAFRTGPYPFRLRRVLVVFQFSFTITLIIATLIIGRQIQHAQNRDQGYDKSNLIYLPLNSNIRNHYEAIKQDLISADLATSVTRSSGTITQQTFGSLNFSWPGSTPEDNNQAFVAITSDTDFSSTTGVQIVQGRDIDIQRYRTDVDAMLLNEAAVKAMRLKNPIGAIVKNGEQQWHVVGVVKDFIFYSPYASINPLFILGSGDWFNYMYLKLSPDKNLSQNLAAIKAVFKQYNPNATLEYNFVDEAYARNFKEEQHTAMLTSLFSMLTIFISCLGLFGLATFTMGQRRKEIGIRKVLGASVGGIVQLLSKEFVKLAVLSVFIASPIAWWAMSKWLDSFTYKIDIAWWMFAVAGLTAVTIALLTVSIQAIRTAIANPVDSLRDE